MHYCTHINEEFFQCVTIWAVVADFLSDAHIFIRKIGYRELTTPCDKPLAPPFVQVEEAEAGEGFRAVSRAFEARD
jgi:hypothetical protein